MFDDLWLVPRGKKKLVLPYEDRADASPIRAVQAFAVSFGGEGRRGGCSRVSASFRSRLVGRVIATSDER